MLNFNNKKHHIEALNVFKSIDCLFSILREIYWRRSGAYIFNFEHIKQINLAVSLLPLNRFFLDS